MTDGPFAEAKEEAVAWAKRCPASGNEVIEIRQVQELSEFPPELQKAAGSVTLGAEVAALLRYKDGPQAEPESHGGCSGKPKFEGVSLTYTAADDAEAEQVFGALARDGQVQHPLGKTFFSSSFGMLTDRFGLGWMVNVVR